ncbi:MAG TPA: 6-bladed beta-propeller [Bacteroidales bacterium]|nr:6-bladed beta-propeller [Bacteroidales bacterium]HRW94517.1 6-bladed beta-propeller [Bacteroidales bacterium]
MSNCRSFFFLFFLILLVTSCRSTSNKEEIKIDETILPLDSTVEIDNLSQYIDSLEIIPIVNDAGISLNEILKMLVTKDNFIVLANGSVYSLTKDGKIFRQYGKTGQVPGKYISVYDICLDNSAEEVWCLCYSFPPKIQKYDLVSHILIEEIEIEPLNATGIIPLKNDGFMLYVPNPDYYDLENFEKDFYCLKIFDWYGLYKEEKLKQKDFNIDAYFTKPVTRSSGNRYVLAPGSSSESCLVYENGELMKSIYFDFGDKTLPAGFAFCGVNNPWKKIEEIFSLDYYKLVSDIYLLDYGVFFTAYGKESSVWHFLKGGSSGIRWRSIGSNLAPPMRAVAADDTFVYFICEDYGKILLKEELDPLKRHVIQTNGFSHENEISIIIKVKFL